MKRRMDWIDWTYLVVIAAIFTAVLGWPTLLMFAGTAVLLYAQQRRLIDNQPLEGELEQMIIDSCPSVSEEHARLLLANLRWRGFEITRVRPPPWRWPQPETGSAFLDEIVCLDRAKFLRGPPH